MQVEDIDVIQHNQFNYYARSKYSVLWLETGDAYRVTNDCHGINRF